MNLDNQKVKLRSKVVVQKEKYTRNIIGKIQKNTLNTAYEKNLENLDIPNKNRIHTRLLDE